MAVGVDIDIPIEQTIVVCDFLVYSLKTNYSNWKDWCIRFNDLYNMASNVYVKNGMTETAWEQYEDLWDWIKNGNVEKNGVIMNELDGTYQSIWNGFPSELNALRADFVSGLKSISEEELFMKHMNYIVSLTGQHFSWMHDIFAEYVADHLGLDVDIVDNLLFDKETCLYSLE